MLGRHVDHEIEITTYDEDEGDDLVTYFELWCLECDAGIMRERA